jgi:hypothetical protein
VTIPRNRSLATFPLRVVLGGVVAAYLASCGGSDEAVRPAGSESLAAPQNVCAWLSPEEIASQLGATPTSSAGAPGLPGCLWRGADGMPLLQVTLVPNAAASADDYRARLAEELGEAWRDDDLTPVAGLGDWAFYTADARMLQVFRGRRTLQVTVSPPAGEGEARALAAALLARSG